MPSASSSVPDGYRLPRTAIPRRYELRMTPDFAGRRFSGHVRVELDVVESVSELVCHAAALQISRARLLGPAGPVDLEIRLDPEREQARLRMPAPVAPAQYTLEADFAGAFDPLLRGFFLSAGIASTQFQSTDARRAFPCWDEPDLKAVFSVTLDVPPGCMGVANGPEVAAQALPDGWRRVTFADTPPMSTYLRAFVIGPLEATAPVDVDGVPLRVVHVPGKAHLAQYALEVGAHALRFFARWTGVPYPAQKLDLIGVPERGGAMENLGAAIFVESALLTEPGADGARRVAEVISHEIAHMWFGDLVTMRWWDGLWINEAFATFITVHCMESFRPDWRPWPAFAVQRDRAMFVDALPSTRPVESPVARPDEAEAMYDLLTYQKGAALLRMLEAAMGAEAFRAGVRRFLHTHAYGNADGDDLWAAIGGPAPEIMPGWIHQGGHPLLEDGAQRPFTLLPGPSSARWDVPDAGSEGYYRVRRHGPWTELGPAARFRAAADTWACVLAGIAPLEAFLDLCPMLAASDDPNLLTVLEDAITTMDHAGGGDALQAWTRGVLRPVVARVGWEAQEFRDAITLLGNVGEDPDVVARGRQFPSVAAAHGGAGDVLAEYRRAADPQTELRHLEALGACRDPELAERLLTMCLGDIKRQHAGALLSRLLANRHVGLLAWDFLRAHWDALGPRFFGKGFWRTLGGAGWLGEEADLRGFLAAQDLGGMRRLADQIVEAQAVRVAFARREGHRLAGLPQRTASSSSSST